MKAEIVYRVEETTVTPELRESWHVNDYSETAYFLIRLTMEVAENENVSMLTEIERKYIALFSFDSEAQRFKRFLELEDNTD